MPGEVMLSGQGEHVTLGLADKGWSPPSFRDDAVLEGRTLSMTSEMRLLGLLSSSLSSVSDRTEKADTTASRWVSGGDIKQRVRKLQWSSTEGEKQQGFHMVKSGDPSEMEEAELESHKEGKLRSSGGRGEKDMII